MAAFGRRPGCGRTQAPVLAGRGTPPLDGRPRHVNRGWHVSSALGAGHPCRRQEGRAVGQDSHLADAHLGHALVPIWAALATTAGATIDAPRPSCATPIKVMSPRRNSGPGRQQEDVPRNPAPMNSPRPREDTLPLHVTFSTSGTTLWVHIGGTVDLSNHHRLHTALCTVHLEDADLINLDLRQLTFCDTHGCRILLLFERGARLSGHQTRIHGARPIVRKVLDCISDGDSLSSPEIRLRRDWCRHRRSGRLASTGTPRVRRPTSPRTGDDPRTWPSSDPLVFPGARAARAASLYRERSSRNGNRRRRRPRRFGACRADVGRESRLVGEVSICLECELHQPVRHRELSWFPLQVVLGHPACLTGHARHVEASTSVCYRIKGLA